MAGLDVTALLLTRGDAHYGEAVTQRDHALQCAALASRDGADDELVLAALLHDLAHLALPDGRDAPERHHGHEGATIVRPFVPARVAWRGIRYRDVRRKQTSKRWELSGLLSGPPRPRRHFLLTAA